MIIEVNDIVYAALTLVFMVIGRYILPTVKEYLISKNAQSKAAKLIEIADQAVKASENLFVYGNNEQKKRYAAEYSAKLATMAGIQITKQQVSDLITAAVAQMDNHKKGPEEK